MHKEVASFFEERIWKVVPKSEMLEHYQKERKKGLDIKRHQLMMIWSFKRKRNPEGKVTKYKARLCCHGGQQQWGVNYWDTYSPVVSWSSIRILMTLLHLYRFHTKSVDFVQAFPQANIKSTIYLKTPAGVEFPLEDQVVLKLLKNLYGLKDAGLTWFEHLSSGLEAMNFKSSLSDPCIFIRNTDIIIVYVDDCCIISKTEEKAIEIFEEIKSKGYKMTDEGTMEAYLGLHIDKTKKGEFTISQPFLIDRIINAIPGIDNAKISKIPAATDQILTKDLHGKERKDNWHYRSIIGMLNYLVNYPQPELAYSVHQCARFCAEPRHIHEQAVKNIVRYLKYLKRINQIGIRYSSNKSKSLETFVDASFAGSWNKTWSDEPTSVMSRTGFLIRYANCPIIWSSKLQTEIALSTTESEYIVLSQSMRDVIPMIDLLSELKNIVPPSENIPTLHYTVFEDNQGCIDLVRLPKLRPRTKHIALKYHHFREHVKNKSISIQYIETENQLADLFTKPLAAPQFWKLRAAIMGYPNIAAYSK